MKKRSIFLCLLFSLLTAGIYNIYWFVSMTNATNELAPKHATMNGIAAFFVSIITVGIYRFYWSFRMGQKADEFLGRDGSSGVLYLFLGVFTFGIVPMCLAQSALNKYLK